ncbi:MAG TPA: hypothetical protein VF581_06060 [Flavobacterium sp.]|jgi:hypothetical protein
MKVKALLLTLLFPMFGFSQLSEEVENLMAEFNTYHVGNDSTKAGLNRNAYRMFARICRASTDDELMHIATKSSYVVKENIGKELVSRKSDRLLDLFSSFISDQNVAHLESKPVDYESTLATELYGAVAFQKEKIERKKYYEETTSDKHLSDVKQLFGQEYETNWNVEEVDSLLTKFDHLAVNSEFILPETLSFIFRSRNFKVADYNRIRTIATRYPHSEILATLANFRNSNDVPHFIKHFDNSFLAVSHFPHPAFLPQLKKRIDVHFDDPEYQEAVASYKTSDSKLMLENILKKIVQKYPPGTIRDEKLFMLYGIMEKKNYSYYKINLSKIDLLLN